MAYNKQTWKDEIPDLTKPIKDASGKQKTDPQTGRPLYELVQEGTRITSARLNHIEDGVEGAHAHMVELSEDIETHASDGVKHLTAAERTAWNAKETPAAAQQKADASLASAKSYTDTQLLTKADKSTTYSKMETDQRIQNVVGAAPAALDTLKEIGDALNNDPNFAATMTTQLSGKVDKIPGKQLSTEDFTSSEKTKLAGLTAGAGGAGSASDAVIGNRTISDTTAPTGDTGTITTLLGWLANMIKSITGKSSWRTAPATTLEAAKAHADDTTRHLTASERTAWNAKETTGGAQAKADAAEAAAKTASIPLSQRNVANGVAALDSLSVVLGQGIKFGSDQYVEQAFVFSPTHGSSINQKIDYTLAAGANVSGFIEVTVTGSWGNQPSQGRLTKRLDIMGSGAGTINRQSTQYTEVSGEIRGLLSISDLYFKDGKWTVTLESRSNNGNSYTTHIKHQGPSGGKQWTQGTLYTGAETTLPLAVQVIPDDTVTKSGYEIQKHKLTNNDGTAQSITGVSINTITVPGIYYITTTVTGTPSTFTQGLCEVYKLLSTNAIVQRITDISGLKTFSRYLTAAGIWGDWFSDSKRATPIPTSSDLNTFIYEGQYVATSNAVSATIANRPIVGDYAFNLQVKTTVGGDGYGCNQTVTYYSVTTGSPKMFTRNYYSVGPVWTTWSEIETTAMKNVALGYPGLDSNGDILLTTIPDVVQKYSLTQDSGKALVLASGTDLNTVLTIGFYTVNAALNAPASSSSWFHIIVQTHSGTSDGTKYVVQRAISLSDAGTPVEWIRRKVNDVWQGTWVSIPNSSLYNVAGGLPQLDNSANVLVDNLPFGGVTNMLGDSGRFVGPDSNPAAVSCSNTFANIPFFSSWNGTTVVGAGKFYHDNSTNGGVSGALTADVTSLLTSMYGSPSARYGTEYHIASYTMGSGTNSPNGVVPTTYLMTANSSFPAGGVGKNFTVSFWIRAKSGTRVVIARDGRLKKNGLVQSTHLQITPADGWMHIETVINAAVGYANGAPNIYATPGDVVQIALPVVVAGGIGVGVHTSPVMGANLGFVPLPAYSYTANDVLSKLITVDGAGSGLDADLHAGKTLADVVQGSLAFAVTAGTAPALTASITPAPAALTAGLRVSIKVHAATTGPVTLNLNGLGAKSIKKPNGNNPPLVQGGVYTVIYDGSVFTLQGEGGEYGTATASDVRLGSTIGTDNGLVTGTLERVFNKNMANMYRSSGETYFLEAYQGKEWIVSDEMTAYHIPDSLSGVSPIKILAGTSILGVNGSVPVITAGDDPAQGVGQWGDGALAVYPSEGYRKGGAGAGEIKVTTAQLQSAEPDLVAGNIKSGVSIYGVAGSLVQGATLVSQVNAQQTVAYQQWVGHPAAITNAINAISNAQWAMLFVAINPSYDGVSTAWCFYRKTGGVMYVTPSSSPDNNERMNPDGWSIYYPSAFNLTHYYRLLIKA
ncbi:pyocin knob domain-containing protein [Paenibacillus sp. FSL R10-2736]|uniref:pyocin knob domain-containing protein n=1 Tax=Paenibacillus sp. FSL R10-2736 TaxID=2954692 RepID=UPI0030F5D0A4